MSPPSTSGDATPTALHEHAVPHRRRPARRTLAALASAALLVAAFTYDYTILANQHATLPGWDLTRFDWVMAACLLVLWWLGIVPLLAAPDRARSHWRDLRENTLALVAVTYLALFTATALVGPILVGDQIANLYLQYQPPFATSVAEGVVGRCVGPVIDGMCHGTLQYPLGTNTMGLGVLYLIVKGARVSFLVALVAATIVAPIATVVGVLSGYTGATLDGLLMRYVDIQEAIPAFLVYILTAFFLGRSLLLLLAVFGLLSWGGVARLVRSETLQRRTAGYVKSARAAGASPLFVVRKHIIPNVASTVVTATTQLIPGLLLAEVALGYLRLNDEVVRSWGWTLSFGLSGHHGTFPTVVNFTGIPPESVYPYFHQKWAPATFTVVAVVLTIAAFAITGDALRDVLDPRST